MTSRPKGRKSTLGTEHPAAPPSTPEPRRAVAVKPATVAAAPAKDKVTVYLDAELAAQARAALTEVPVRRHGFRNLSELVAKAIEDLVTDMQRQHNDGQPWPPAEAGDVPRGRPTDKAN